MKPSNKRKQTRFLLSLIFILIAPSERVVVVLFHAYIITATIIRRRRGRISLKTTIVLEVGRVEPGAIRVSTHVTCIGQFAIYGI